MIINTIPKTVQDAIDRCSDERLEDVVRIIDTLVNATYDRDVGDAESLQRSSLRICRDYLKTAVLPDFTTIHQYMENIEMRVRVEQDAASPALR